MTDEDKLRVLTEELEAVIVPPDASPREREKLLADARARADDRIKNRERAEGALDAEWRQFDDAIAALKPLAVKVAKRGAAAGEVRRQLNTAIGDLGDKFKVMVASCPISPLPPSVLNLATVAKEDPTSAVAALDVRAQEIAAIRRAQFDRIPPA
jgi:hypothetical protein